MLDSVFKVRMLKQRHVKSKQLGRVSHPKKWNCTVPPLHVLHVVENLNRGAVENWLIRMLRHARRRGLDLEWTFYCALGQRGSIEEEARALGAQVVYSPVPIGNKARFVRALRAELQRGQYDVLHCHHDLVSAVYLLAAARLSIRRRIVHVHNADEAVLTPNRVKQSLYREPMRLACLAMADLVIGISNHTLDTFLGGRPRKVGRDIVHYYGVDSAPFQSAAADRVSFRRQLGLSEDSSILLFAGRMVPEKNPLFAVEVLAKLHQALPNVAGVFMGCGSLDEAIRERAVDLGLGRVFRQLGWRGDVAEVMCCCDWFILPRPENRMEGFGLAVTEAQLAGLRLLLSQTIPDDALLPKATVQQLPLSAGPGSWAQAGIQLLRGPAPSRADAFAALRKSPMDMDRALEALLDIHGHLADF
jgi:glycosyltransferase involved in cell wall biosynthesis